ncbi:DEAD-domain-containing protein [Hesseltinella vesiculosa]|uniref:RNA helicase n=1 Tax=Hesseltinella vesiculosa TaxID=101127 RepID=A0A1X2GL26_9FUNG|nr:DEAD-domain-containing protein [Hesseltinella vesiculosa]
MSPTALEETKKRKRINDAPVDKSEKKKAKKDKKEKKEKKEKKAEHTRANTTTSALATLADYKYEQDPQLSQLPQATIDAFLKENAVDVQGDLKLRPILSFTHTRLPDNVMHVFQKFEKPTPIQATTWPISLSGRDIVGIAETGSGKTYAFTIPGLVHISSKLLKAEPAKRKPTMLVVSPTRELAMQSQEQAEEAGKAFGIRSVCLYGGVSKEGQRSMLEKGVDIVVATPGRLIDLLNEGYCDLSEVTFLVLDEADRMLDDGFEKDIRAIMDATPKNNRQTLMFSATWPESIRKLANEYLNNPMRVSIGSTDLAASQNIKQIVQVIDNPRDKEYKLIELLNKIHRKQNNRVLVFALYKKEAARIEFTLRRQGFKVVGIHGDKNQAQRTEALAQFKDGSLPLMVATDVAARGLDIPDVEYVINLTFPLTIESYVHRIGRTGRGGKKGTAYTFFTAEDKSHSGELINVLKQANQQVPPELMKFGTTVKKKTHGAYGAFFKETADAPKATKIIFD